MTVALDDVEQRTTLTVRHVTQRDLLLVVGDAAVYLLKYGYQLLDEGITFGIYLFPTLRHLFFPYLHKVGIGLVVHLQHSVSLLKGFVVTVQ